MLPFSHDGRVAHARRFASGARRPWGRNASGARRPWGATASGARRPWGRNASGARRPWGRNASGARRPWGRNASGAHRPWGGNASGARPRCADTCAHADEAELAFLRIHRFQSPPSGFSPRRMAIFRSSCSSFSPAYSAPISVRSRNQNVSRIWFHRTPPWADSDAPSLTKPNLA